MTETIVEVGNLEDVKASATSLFSTHSHGRCWVAVLLGKVASVGEDNENVVLAIHVVIVVGSCC